MRRELAALGIRTPWAALRAARNFAKTVWDPTRSDIQHGINTLIHDGLRQVDRARIEQLERERPALAALHAEGYDPDIDPRPLEALPEGSLGREYARFIRANAIDPLATLLAMGAPTNLAQYLFRRAYELHDVQHVVASEWLALGERAQPYVEFRMEDLFERPVAEVRALVMAAG